MWSIGVVYLVVFVSLGEYFEFPTFKTADKTLTIKTKKVKRPIHPINIMCMLPTAKSTGSTKHLSKPMGVLNMFAVDVLQHYLDEGRTQDALRDDIDMFLPEHYLRKKPANLCI